MERVLRIEQRSEDAPSRRSEWTHKPKQAAPARMRRQLPMLVRINAVWGVRVTARDAGARARATHLGSLSDRFAHGWWLKPSRSAMAEIVSRADSALRRLGRDRRRTIPLRSDTPPRGRPKR